MLCICLKMIRKKKKEEDLSLAIIIILIFLLNTKCADREQSCLLLITAGLRLGTCSSLLAISHFALPHHQESTSLHKESNLLCKLLCAQWPPRGHIQNYCNFICSAPQLFFSPHGPLVGFSQAAPDTGCCSLQLA